MKDFEIDTYFREFYHWIHINVSSGGFSVRSAEVVEDDGETHRTRFFLVPPITGHDYYTEP